MKSSVADVSITIDLLPGERLALPAELVEKLGPGRWTITVRRALPEGAPRRHDSFLSGYAPEDEGLYDEITG